MPDLPRLDFVNYVTAKGRTYARFRSKETGRINLKGLPPDPEFHRAYTEALELRARLRAGDSAAAPDSLAALVGRYLKSAEFAALADPTQLDYSRTLDVLQAELGDQPFRYITRAMLKAVRDDFAGTPRKANKLQQMASRLYSWANEADLVPDGVNPAVGLKKLRRKGGEKEIVPWSDAEIGWILGVAPRHVATPVLLALYTGQRREDVCRMTWQQVQGDVVRVRQSKTRALLDMPCHPVLKAHLDQLRAKSKVVSLTGTICLTEKGAAFSVNGLSGAVRRVVEKHPRVPDNRSMHGLRYAAAGRMEEGGATVAAIEAVLGHRTFRMALKYASARLRAREGVAAMKSDA